jgi:autotransporter-associated beta strand protein
LKKGVVTSVLGGVGGLVKTTDGEVTLGAENLYGGATVVSGGRLVLGVSGALPASTALTVDGGELALGVTVQQSGAVVMNGGLMSGGMLTGTGYALRSGTVTTVLGGSGGLTKTTSGTLTLSGLNTYLGDTVISGGVLAVTRDGALSVDTSVFVNTGGELALGNTTQTVAAFVLNGGTLSGGRVNAGTYLINSGTINSAFFGSGYKNGEGTLNLMGRIDVEDLAGGSLDINGGAIVLGAADRLGDRLTVLVNGGTLDLAVNAEKIERLILRSGAVASTTGVLEAGRFDVEAGAISAILGGSGVLTKTTEGEVTLGRANAYVGGTAVEAGRLVLGVSDALSGVGSVTVNGGELALGVTDQAVGVVTVNGGLVSGGVLTGSEYRVTGGEISSVLAGGAGLVKAGAGEARLMGVNTYAGGTTVEAGRLVLGVDGALSGTGAVTVNGGELALGVTAQTVGSVTVNGGLVSGGVLTGAEYRVTGGEISSVLAGGAVLVKAGAGEVRLTGANTYVGGTMVEAGRLALGVDGALSGTGAVTVNGGELVLGATVQSVGVVTVNGGLISGGVLTGSEYRVTAGEISSVLAGAAGLTKTTGGVVTLSGRNTFRGDTVLEAGVLALSVDGAISGASRVVVRGGELSLGETSQSVLALGLEGGVVRGGRLEAATTSLLAGELDTVLFGAGSVTKSGTGLLNLSGRIEVSGGLTVSGGTLRLASADRIGDGVRLTMEGGVLDLNGTVETVGRVRLRGGELVNGSLLALAYELESGAVSTVFGGTGSLVKTTSGEVVLNSVNTYSGSTFVEGGVLRLGVDGALSALTGVSVSSGAELALGATGQVIDSLRVEGGLVSGGVLTARSVVLEGGTVSSVLAGAGSLTKTTAGEAVLSGVNTYTGATLVEAGRLVLAGDNVLSGSTALTVRGGELALGATRQSVGVVALSGGVVRGGELSGARFEVESGLVDAVLFGEARLTKRGVGEVVLARANTYVGGTVVEAGRLVLGVNDALASGSSVTVSGGELALGTTRQVLGLVTLDGGTMSGGTVVGGSYVMRAGLATSVLAGAGGLIKEGEGTVRLTGVNTFGGAVRVNAGVLSLDGAGQTVSSTVVGVEGGVLELGRGEQISDAAAVTLRGGVFRFALGVSGQVETVRTFLNEGGLLETGANTLRGIGSTIRLAGGRTVVGDGGVLTDHHVVISGGENVVQAGGTLVVEPARAGETGLELVANASGLPLLSLGVEGSRAASLRLANDVMVTGTGVAEIAVSGVGTARSVLTLEGGSRLVDVAAGAQLGVAADVSGSRLVKAGAGEMAVGGALALTDGLLVSGGVLGLGGRTDLGRLEVGTGSGLTVTGDLRVAGGSEFRGTATVSGGAVLSGSVFVNGGEVGLFGQSVLGSDVRVGSGRLSLGGVTTMDASRTVRMEGGSTVLASDAGLGSGRLEFAGGRLVYGSGVTVDVSSQIQSLTGGVEARIDTNGQAVAFGVGVTGNGVLVKEGAGRLTMNGTNALVGGLRVEGGEFALGERGVLGTTQPVVVAGGALNLNGTVQAVGDFRMQSGSLTGGVQSALTAASYVMESGFVDVVLKGGISLLKTTAGKVVLGQNAQYTGMTNIQSGVLEIGVGGSVGMVGPGTIFIAEIFGKGRIELSGGGSVRLSTNNRLEGGAAITAGTVVTLTDDRELGAVATNGPTKLLLADATVKIPSGTSLVMSPQRTIELGAGTSGKLDIQSGASLEFGGEITGGGALVKQGAGQLKLSGSGTYAGDTVISSGTLLVADSLSASPQMLGQTTGEVKIGAAGPALVIERSQNISIGNVISGQGGIQASLQGSVLSLSGANTFTGETVVKGGTLEVTDRVSGGVVESVGTLGAGSVRLEDTQLRFALNAAGSRLVVENDIRGFADVVKSGAGTLELAGSVQLSAALAGGAAAARVDVTAGELVLAAVGRPALEKLARLEISGGVVKIRGDEQISESASVVISSGGLMFDSSVSGRVERILSLRNEAGFLRTGANTLRGIGSTMEWLGGTNTIDEGGRIIDHHWMISGGANTVKAGGVLTVEPGVSLPSGLELTAAATALIGLESAAGVPGVLELANDVVVRPLAGSGVGARIVSEGSGLNAGVIRLSGLRSLNVMSGDYAGLSLGVDVEDGGGSVGGLVKVGGGVLELAGAGRFTGGVSMRDGTLMLSNATALGTGVLTVEGASVRVRSGAVAVSLANAVDLKSDVTLGVVGGEGLTLAGGTRLNGRRTLTVESAVSLASMVDGAVAGSALVKAGLGSLTMTGVNAYTGETVVNAGRLVLANGAALTATPKITVAAGASIDLGNYAFTHSVMLSGDGLFDGSPVLGIAGKMVELNPGSVGFAGALSPFAKGSNATTRFGNVVFAGYKNGVELSNVVTVGFNVKTGQADQVDVNGQVTFRTTEVAPASVSKVDLKDVVHFRVIPEVRVSAVGRTVIPKAILKAQAVNGADGAGRALTVVSDDRRLETSSSAVLSYRLNYDATNKTVNLVVDRASYADFAKSANSASLGRYLDKQVAFDGGSGVIKLSNAVKASSRSERYSSDDYNDDLLSLLDDLGTEAEVAAVLAQLDGSAYAELNQVARKRLVDLANPIDQRLNALAMFGSRTKGTDSGIGTGVERWSLWNASYGTQTQRDADAGAGFRGYSNSSQGSIMGIELPTNGFRSGLLASSSTDRFNFAMPMTSVRTDAWHVGLYSATSTEPWFADAMMLYGRTDSTSTRQIHLGKGVSRTARARFDGDEALVQLGVGAQMAPVESKWEITPTARLMLSSVSTSRISETGAEGVSLIGSNRRATSLTSKVGIGISKSGQYRGMRTVFRARADWFRDYSGLRSEFTGRFAGAPNAAATFTNRSAEALRDAFLFSASMEIGFTERLSLRLSGEYELRSTMRTWSGNVSIGVEF